MSPGQPPGARRCAGELGQRSSVPSASAAAIMARASSLCMVVARRCDGGNGLGAIDGAGCATQRGRASARGHRSRSRCCDRLAVAIVGIGLVRRCRPAPAAAPSFRASPAGSRRPWSRQQLVMAPLRRRRARPPPKPPPPYRRPSARSIETRGAALLILWLLTGARVLLRRVEGASAWPPRLAEGSRSRVASIIAVSSLGSLRPLRRERGGRGKVGARRSAARGAQDRSRAIPRWSSRAGQARPRRRRP